MLTLDQVTAKLDARYGRLPPLAPKSAFEWIVWENCCYLVNDARRGKVFTELKAKVGVDPRSLLDADRKTLLAILEPGGMRPPMRLEKLIDAATLCVERHDGDLDPILELPRREAMRELKRYPGVGVPGAEKLLLFCAKAPILALESNGLRVLLRLGYGSEDARYDVTYASVQRALAGQVGDDAKRLVALHRLLRHHGQELCRRSDPLCPECPLRRHCTFAAAAGR